MMKVFIHRRRRDSGLLLSALNRFSRVGFVRGTGRLRRGNAFSFPEVRLDGIVDCPHFVFRSTSLHHRFQSLLGRMIRFRGAFPALPLRHQRVVYN